MFSVFNSRFGIPGAISIIALVFAMIGGAYAASNDGSAKKASASAKAKQGPRGPRGKRGPAGAQGPAGAAGIPGAPGLKGANGAEGPKGASGAQGLQGLQGAQGPAGPAGAPGATGPEGSPWTAGGTLPSGETETGMWSIPPATEAGFAFVPISFPIPLAAALPSSALHVLGPGEGETTDCPGTLADPQAASGQLCLYALALSNASFSETAKSLIASFKSGFFVAFELTAASPLPGGGSFAVTAP